MVSSNRIQRGDPPLKEALLGFLDSASSLCDMMNTTMAAILNEIMSIQANEACGAEGATRCGYREHGTLTLSRQSSNQFKPQISGSTWDLWLFLYVGLW